ncbi:MAG: hypothetical protein RRA92_11450, partial [Gemmatimonadota bacterium]|nr:hypothetical protein [Gemmatimonadota bacterium]
PHGPTHLRPGVTDSQDRRAGDVRSPHVRVRSCSGAAELDATRTRGHPMSAIRRSLASIALVLLVAGGAACDSSTGLSSTFATRGTLEFFAVDAGCWLLIGEGGTRFELLDLPLDFQEPGTDVQATLEFATDTGSRCMAGTLVRVRRIERVEP